MNLAMLTTRLVQSINAACSVLLSLMLGAVAMPVMADADNGSQTWGVGVRVGVENAGATSGWSDESFTTGIDSSDTSHIGLVGFYQHRSPDTGYRLSLASYRASWNNASTRETELGADYLWIRKDRLTPYLGPRLGIVRFHDRHTGDSGSGRMLGMQMGVLVATEGWTLLAKLGEPELEAFARYHRPIARNHRSVGNQTHSVSLDRLLSVGVGLNWTF